MRYYGKNLGKNIQPELFLGKEIEWKIPLPTPKMLSEVHPSQYRFRIGTYRIRGYMEGKIFSVLRIRHRSDIYKDL